MADTKITVHPNGPYLVQGEIMVVDADGNTFDVSGRPMVALCRFGGSSTKPFYDGTHSRIGFAAAEAAVKKAEEGKAE